MIVTALSGAERFADPLLIEFLTHPAQIRTYAAIFDSRGERHAKARLAAGWDSQVRTAIRRVVYIVTVVYKADYQ